MAIIHMNMCSCIVSCLYLCLLGYILSHLPVIYTSLLCCAVTYPISVNKKMVIVTLSVCWGGAKTSITT